MLGQHIDADEAAARMRGRHDDGGYPLAAAEIAPSETSRPRRRRDARKGRDKIEPSWRQLTEKAAGVGNVGDIALTAETISLPAPCMEPTTQPAQDAAPPHYPSVELRAA